jgi:hypothetical protein
LPGRLVVDDCDAAQRRVTALRLPFSPEHCDKDIIELVERCRRVEHAVHRRAAGTMRARGRCMEERASRIGVDLDQPGPVRSHMEVVAHEHTLRTPALRGDGRRPPKCASFIRGQVGDAMEHGDTLREHVEVAC